MFGKSDLADSLNRDLARARDKRDALASGVATLTAQIAELEARLSAENDRRERERAAIEYSALLNGCLTAIRQRKNQLKIAPQQHDRPVILAAIRRALAGCTLGTAPHAKKAGR